MEQSSCNSNLPSATTSTKEHVVEEEEPAWQMVAEDNSEKALTMEDLQLLQDLIKATIPTSVELSTKYIIKALVKNQKSQSVSRGPSQKMILIMQEIVTWIDSKM